MNAKAAAIENEKAFLSSTLQRIIGSLSAQSGSFFLFDEVKNELVLTAYHNARGFELTGLKKQFGEGISGAVIKMNKPVLVKDVKTDPRFSRNGFKHYIGSSFISVPLFFDGRLAGLVNITDKSGGEAFTEKDLAFAESELKSILKSWLEQHHATVGDLPEIKECSAPSKVKFQNMTGRHPKIQKIFTLVQAVASTRATVLISGESGTGKRLVAHAIHNCNPLEQGKPFVEVSCGALTETLLESELFGHVKGSFTGAHKDRTGRFEMADKGTIFLDEIDSFSLAMQVKLLRVLQDGGFERVGDNKTVKVDIRIIAATNQDLPTLIEQGKFRKDLYYRLNIINIEVPPLRDRVSDIDLLVQDLINKHAAELGRDVKSASEEVLEKFRTYPWPGNIRELENVVERAVILAQGPEITLAELPDHFRAAPAPQAEDGKLRSALKGSEQELIEEALASVNGNRNKAAEKLGIDRTTLYKKMVKNGMLKRKNSLILQ